MINKKTMVLFGIGLAIITLVLVGKMIFESNQGSKTEYISENEYRSYSKFGIIFDGNESEIFEYLNQNLKFDGLEPAVESENVVTYMDISVSNYEFIESHLIDCKEITEILGSKKTKEGEFVNYIIDYLNKDNKRIILEYAYTGFVQKTFEEKNLIVSISSDFKKMILRK